jgi:hypothetical protein
MDLVDYKSYQDTIDSGICQTAVLDGYIGDKCLVKMVFKWGLVT